MSAVVLGSKLEPYLSLAFATVIQKINTEVVMANRKAISLSLVIAVMGLGILGSDL